MLCTCIVSISHRCSSAVFRPYNLITFLQQQPRIMILAIKQKLITVPYEGKSYTSQEIRYIQNKQTGQGLHQAT